jgi:phosphopantothenoylcysteine decarboxylase/phosphopantothenate--cysteine ligase
MKFIITAGPTREHIDPVRFLSNPSTGKMGFAVAAEAARRGHETVLVAGPVSLRTPPGVRRIDVVSARDMLAAVKNEVIDGAVFVGVAAVADFRPAVSFNKKQKKSAMTGELKLVRNPDILKSLKSLPVTRVGFAAETNDVLAEASRKCREKNLKFIVANDVLAKGSGFGVSTNRVTFVYPDGSLKKFPLMSKRRVAERILDEIDRA